MRADSQNDATVKAKVQSALNADSALYDRHIDVSVTHGVVHLSGVVQKSEDIDKAKQDAAAVAGVKNVKNEITLKQGESESNTSGG